MHVRGGVQAEHARGLQALGRVLGHHGEGGMLCPRCSEHSQDWGMRATY